MREEIIEQLLDINRKFYQTFAKPFVESRWRPQPGVLKSCSWIMQGGSVLELGCGHGQLPKTLHAQGFCGKYTGLDSSNPLLEFARQHQLGLSYRFLEADLTEQGWTKVLGENPPATTTEQLETFDQICAFATLHHIPGDSQRRVLLKEIVSLLAPVGELTLSTWDFLRIPRLRERILPWESVELTQQDVEQGDYLLDWRRGGRGFRYVHHFTPNELETLAVETGCRVTKTFTSDGETGKLGHYQVWMKR